MRSQKALTNTVIIGAGPAGLAVGACLKRAGVPFIMLEQADRVGSVWHDHYDRLHLHTNKAGSNLPFYRFPNKYPRYPSRDQVIEYLEAYADRFELAPRFGQRVVSARYQADRWETQTQDALYRSQHLVVATGYARVPRLPSWPGQAGFEGPFLHSSSYKNGRSLRGKRVLVVGFGNSGAEIALDLWEHGARPSLAVRSPVNIIPRDLLGLPVVAIAVGVHKLPLRLADTFMAPVLRLMYGNIERLGFRKLPYGPLTQIERDARIPVIDVGAMKLIKEGDIAVYGGIERFDGNEVTFEDGHKQRFDAAILATGYRPQVEAFLENGGKALDAEGTPLSSGREALPGLFFCGFHVSPTGVLREIAIEARRIAGVIGSRVDRATPGNTPSNQNEEYAQQTQ